jgi:hypothetical protein
MPFVARKVEYFYANLTGDSEDAYDTLTQFANVGVNLLGLVSIPMGPETIQFTLFAEDPLKLQSAARAAGLVLDGPHEAVLVQGADEPGAIARVHARLREADVDCYASSGVTDGKGFFGYILYVRPKQADTAARALAG